MTEKENLIMTEALGALLEISKNTDGYVCCGIACGSLWVMARIARTGSSPTSDEIKDFLRSQGFQSWVTRAGSN